MATQPAVRDWTYAEFARLPDDGNRYEVIAGELEVTPSPRPKHQDLIGGLAEVLRPFVRRRNLGRIYPGPSTSCSRKGTISSPTWCSFAASSLGW